MGKEYLPKEIVESFHLKTRTELIKKGIVRTYKKKEHIYWDGDGIDSVHILISGITGIYKLNHKDKKVIFINKPYEFLNISAIFEQKTSVSCEALVDSEILSYRIPEFIELMEQDCKLSQWAMREMAMNMKRMYRQLKNTSNAMNLEEQILSKLWKLAKDFGTECPEGIRIEFPCTITYLAEIVGSKRESVSRKVKVLVDKGYIIYKNNKFIVVDMEQISKNLRNSSV